MAFKILYQEGNDLFSNLASIAVYLDAFAKNLGLKELSVDPEKLRSVAGALSRPDFPHADGLDKASPFKKAANFFVWFVAERPIRDELPESLIGKELKGINNHQNVIFAYHMAIDCLHGAKLFKGDKEVVLDEKIKVSQHFFKDFVEAFSAATPCSHFHIASLLFEQMAYKAAFKSNKDFGYEENI